MDKLEREVMQVAKEITVKFIEVQRVSPAIYKVVLATALEGREKAEKEQA